MGFLPWVGLLLVATWFAAHEVATVPVRSPWESPQWRHTAAGWADMRDWETSITACSSLTAWFPHPVLLAMLMVVASLWGLEAHAGVATPTEMTVAEDS